MPDAPASNINLDWARREVGIAVLTQAEEKYGPFVPYALGIALGFGLFLFMVGRGAAKAGWL